MLLSLAHIPDPVEFAPGTEIIAGKLASVLTGWPSGEVGSGTPFMMIARGQRGYWIERPDDGWRVRAPTQVTAISILIVEIVDALIANGRHLGALHAAAAHFYGRLVLFPAESRAGKSTLMARLAASDHRIFADDLMPIDLDSGEAIAIGCLPRLRLPLPCNARPDFSAFVRRRLRIKDSRYGYVEPRAGRKVTFGERAPVGAVVTLSRSLEPVAASLQSISLGDAALCVLLRDTRRNVATDQLLDDYLSIIGDIPGFRLVYSDLEDGVSCLEGFFRSWSDQAGDGCPGSLCKLSRARSRKSPTRDLTATVPHAGSARYRRRRHIRMRLAEDQAFLIDPNANELFHLNTIGMAVWNLLDEPSDAASMIGLFRTAFPESDPATLEADIARLLERLLADGLIEKDPTGSRVRTLRSPLPCH